MIGRNSFRKRSNNTFVQDSLLNFYKRETEPKTEPLELRKRKPAENQRVSRFYKWYHQDSNLGHTDFQSDALPTELWHHCFSFAGAKVGISF